MKRLSLTLLLLTSCSPYTVQTFERPTLEIPASYYQTKGTQPDSQVTPARFWWREFNDPVLNDLVRTALKHNQSLIAAWQRLLQADAERRSQASALYPQLTLGAEAARIRLEDNESEAIQGFSRSGTFYDSDFVLRNGLSLEVDLFKRILSKRSAAALRRDATSADVGATALLLSGRVVELWFIAQEQRALLDILKNQIQTGETLLELTELRYSVGRGSALEVFQQREQLASTKSQVPLANLQLALTTNELATLLGKAPGTLAQLGLSDTLPALPPFPSLLQPVDLLTSRPDLRAALLQLQAGEYDIAVAVAERFPRLSVGLSYEFSASDVDTLFKDELGSLFSNLTLPLTDGGNRRAQVARTTARRDELIATLNNSYLQALREVEDAIARERHQKELVLRLEEQLRASKASLKESQTRYANGLTNYLDVIVALQSSQAVERRVVSERRALLVARARLYRALGGEWTKNLHYRKSEDALLGELAL